LGILVEEGIGSIQSVHVLYKDKVLRAEHFSGKECTGICPVRRDGPDLSRLFVETVGRSPMSYGEDSQVKEHRKLQEIRCMNTHPIPAREEEGHHDGVLLTYLSREFRKDPGGHPEIQAQVK